MLMPKRVKYRKAQRGRMKGIAVRGSTLAFGDFGLKALEPGWVTKTSRSPRSRPRPGWARARATRRSGWRS